VPAPETKAAARAAAVTEVASRAVVKGGAETEAAASLVEAKAAPLASEGNPSKRRLDARLFLSIVV